MRAKWSSRKVEPSGKQKHRCVINAAFSVVRIPSSNEVDLPAYFNDSRSMSVCLRHDGGSTRLRLSKGVPVHEGEPETSELLAHPIQRRLCLTACLHRAAGSEADCSSLAHHRFLKHPQRSVSIRVRLRCTRPGSLFTRPLRCVVRSHSDPGIAEQAQAVSAVAIYAERSDASALSILPFN